MNETQNNLARRAWELGGQINRIRIDVEARLAPSGSGRRTEVEVQRVIAWNESPEGRIVHALWDLAGLVCEVAGGVAGPAVGLPSVQSPARAPADPRSTNDTVGRVFLEKAGLLNPREDQA